MALNERARIAWIALPMQHARRAGVGFAVLLDLFARRQPDDGITGTATGTLVGGVEIVGMQFGVILRHTAKQRDAPNIIEIAWRVAGGEPMRHFNDSALGIAVKQQVRFGIREDRTAHLLGPIVVMRNTAQRRPSMPPSTIGTSLKSLAATLGINDGAAVRPFAALAAGRVGIVMAQSSVRRVAVHHRIHVAAGDAEEHPWLAESLERLGRAPIGLRDDADPKPLGFEQPADDCHAEARVIDSRRRPSPARCRAGIPAERASSRRGSSAGTAPLCRNASGGRQRHQGFFNDCEIIHGATHKTRACKFNQPAPPVAEGSDRGSVPPLQRTPAVTRAHHIWSHLLMLGTLFSWRAETRPQSALISSTFPVAEGSDILLEPSDRDGWPPHSAPAPGPIQFRPGAL